MTKYKKDCLFSYRGKFFAVLEIYEEKRTNERQRLHNIPEYSASY